MQFAPLVVAIAVNGLGLLFSWRGEDLPAQVMRSDWFRLHGFTLWHPQWYGGHASLDYSVLSPAIGAYLSPLLVVAVANVLATVLFTRIARRSWGANAIAGALWFSVASAANLAVGRVAFAVGLALALAVIDAVQREKMLIATGAALLTSLLSPVAGVFVVIAVAAHWLTSERKLIASLAGAGAFAPMAATAMLFPVVGSFPYTSGAIVRDVAVGILVILITPRAQRALRIGAALYLATCLVAFLIDTPLGANVSRLGQMVGGAIIACILWARPRRWGVLVAVGLLLWPWLPAIDGVFHGPSDPATKSGYFVPLNQFLTTQQHRFDGHGGIGRVEVVPLRRHWESVYVGERFAIARGWERQLDIGYNKLFYEGRFDATVYHSWLIDNSVQFVALADADLDRQSKRELALLQQPPTYLHEVFHDAHWHVWSVEGYHGFVEGPATVRQNPSTPDRFEVLVTTRGSPIIHIRWSPRWTISASTCLRETEQHWIRMVDAMPGRYVFEQTLGGANACS